VGLKSPLPIYFQMFNPQGSGDFSPTDKIKLDLRNLLESIGGLIEKDILKEIKN